MFGWFSKDAGYYGYTCVRTHNMNTHLYASILTSAHTFIPLTS